jgi:hypothetical protein
MDAAVSGWRACDSERKECDGVSEFRAAAKWGPADGEERRIRGGDPGRCQSGRVDAPLVPRLLARKAPLPPHRATPS